MEGMRSEQVIGAAQEARMAGLAAAVQMRDTDTARLYDDITHLAGGYARFILTGIPLSEQGGPDDPTSGHRDLVARLSTQWGPIDAA